MGLLLPLPDGALPQVSLAMSIGEAETEAMRPETAIMAVKDCMMMV